MSKQAFLARVMRQSAALTPQIGNKCRNIKRQA